MAERIEELMTSEYRNKVVQRTLSSLSRLSGETRSRFEGVIRKKGGVRGYRDPFKAPRPLLQSYIVDEMNRAPLFNFVVLDIWAETQPELRDLVREHFSGLQDEFEEDTPPEFLAEQAAQLAESNGEFEDADIELMMHYVAHLIKEIGSEILRDGDVEESESESPSVAELLAKTLDYLTKLSVESTEWDDHIPNFAQALAELIDEKQRGRAQELQDSLKRIRGEFASDIVFFEHSADDWNIDNLTTSADISEAARVMSELESGFQVYRTIKGEDTDNIVAERERRSQLGELEEHIEGTLAEMDELAQHAASIENTPLTEGETASETDSTPETQPQPDALIELQDELRALKQDNDLITDAFRSSQGEVTGLKADKQSLADEVTELRNQLQISEGQELYWRRMYETEMSSNHSTPLEPIPTEVESVRQALELAKARYGDKLLFRLNKKSDPDYSYNRPKEVWDALEWLATTYHATQTGEIRVVDLNDSIRNTCGGWEYKPNQKDITFNMYREWYTTTVDGATYELRKHIGRGTSRRDNNIIRIAFAWDDESSRVIVGYIGPHQRNRNS